MPILLTSAGLGGSSAQVPSTSIPSLPCTPGRPAAGLRTLAGLLRGGALGPGTTYLALPSYPAKIHSLSLYTVAPWADLATGNL